MIATDDFDPSAYMSSPRLDVPSQIALGRQLLAAAPADLPPPAVATKKRLLLTIRNLEDGYQESQTSDPDPLKRPIDLFSDNSWASVKARLEPYTWLNEDEFPIAGRAKTLSRQLFPTGLSFTQLEYGAQWAEASWRIKLIADEKLEPELRRLCGDTFIDELYRWHKEYGKMVGATRRPSDGKAKPRPNLGELRRQAGQAIVAWQAQLVALHLSGHTDARAALQPTDDYRDKLAASGSKPAPDPKLPEGPAATPAVQAVAMTA